jgi:arsenite methyltransferase
MDSQSAIREKYGSIAKGVTEKQAAACCDPAMRCCDPITKDLYGAMEKGELPGMRCWRRWGAAIRLR